MISLTREAVNCKFCCRNIRLDIVKRAESKSSMIPPHRVGQDSSKSQVSIQMKPISDKSTPLIPSNSKQGL